MGIRNNVNDVRYIFVVALKRLGEMEHTHIQKYGSWLNRILAYIIDLGLVLLFVAPLNYLNITGGKNFLWYLMVVLISISYKPLLEFYYKKTLGKYLFGLMVNDLSFKKINLFQVYLRNVFFILPRSRAIASRGLPSFNVVTVLTVLVSI